MRLLEIRAKIPRGIYVIASIAGFVIPLALWQLVTSMHLVGHLFLPSPSRVFVSFLRWTKSTLWLDTVVSVKQVLYGFVIAAIIGVPTGLFIGTFKFIEALLQPINDFIRYMPASAFIPLVLLWVGIGTSAKVSIILIGVLFQIIVMVADVVRNVPQKYVEALLTMGAKRTEVIKFALLDGAAPDILNILRVNMGWAWTYLVVAELIAANKGLGFAIMQAQKFMDTPRIFVGIIVIGTLGLLFDLVFRLIHRIIFSWMYI